MSRPGRPPAIVAGGRLAEGEPLSAWYDEVRDVEEVIRSLRMLGAFSTRDRAPDEWEWLCAEGRLDGPRDLVVVLNRARELTNRKLAEHRVVLALVKGTSLPLPYALANATPIAAMWKRIAECFAQVNRIRFCEVCQRPLVYDGKYRRPGRRKDARVCSVRCRVEKYRRAKKGDTQ